MATQTRSRHIFAVGVIWCAVMFTWSIASAQSLLTPQPTSECPPNNNKDITSWYLQQAQPLCVSKTPSPQRIVPRMWGEDVDTSDSSATSAPVVVKQASTQSVAEQDAGWEFVPLDQYHLVPTLQLGLALDMTDGFQDFFLWGGLRFFAEPTEWSLYAEAGVEFVFAESVSIVPTLRIGTALLIEDPKSFVSQMLPAVMFYGIVGMYVPDRFNPQTVRVGLGITSPLGLIISLIAMGEAGVPIPNGLELVGDYDAITAEQTVTLKLVFGF